jgi:class 3 adenylate cyclase
MRTAERPAISEGVMESLRLVYDAETDSADRDAIPAAEQDVVVMFTDLVGFSRIAAMTGSRAAGALLSRALGEQIALVQASGGVVRNIMGDGIMASWTIGRESGRAATAARAVRVAFTIATAMEKHPSPLPDQRGLGVRIGLHAGPVLFDTIAAGHIAGRTLIGDTVNIAAKLEQARRVRAESLGAIRVSEELFRELGPVQRARFALRTSIRAAGRRLCLRSSAGAEQALPLRSPNAETGSASDLFPMRWDRRHDGSAGLVEAA